MNFTRMPRLTAVGRIKAAKTEDRDSPAETVATIFATVMLTRGVDVDGPDEVDGAPGVFEVVVPGGATPAALALADHAADEVPQDIDVEHDDGPKGTCIRFTEVPSEEVGNWGYRGWFYPGSGINR